MTDWKSLVAAFADMDPFVDYQHPDGSQQCFYCGGDYPDDHEEDCLWCQAVEAVGDSLDGVGEAT